MPTYDGFDDADAFLDVFEREVQEKQHFQAFDWVVPAIPARQWGMHKGSFDGWCECRRMVRTCLGKLKVR